MHVFAFIFFLRSFKTKKNLLSFSKDTVFNFWLSKVKFFIPHEGFFFSLSVFAIIYLPVSRRMRISKPVAVGLDCCLWCEES